MTTVVRTEIEPTEAAGRPGFLLRLFDDLGRTGVGEASPLPGRSPDTPADCRAALARLPPAMDLPSTPPAACFALETALLDLHGELRGEPPADLCALAGSVDAARRAVDRGRRAVKVKSLALARKVRRALPDVELRVDVNGAWTLEEAPARLREAAEIAPAWIEQPVSADDLPALGASPVPIAADESLARRAVRRRLLGSRVARVWVLKPTILGGIRACLELAREARARGIEVVASHAFEGPVGMRGCHHLAHALASPLAAGLDRWP